MSKSRHGWEQPDESPTRDISVFEMTPEPGATGVNPVASTLGNWVREKLEQLRGWRERRRVGRQSEGGGNAARITGQATATAIGAIEGKLKGQSLEGELKLAEIERTYAEAREKNAAAAFQDAQAQKLRQDIAFERVERSLKLFAELGVSVNVVTLEDGRTAIAIGDGLVAEVPTLMQGPPFTAEPVAPASMAESEDTDLRNGTL